MLANFYWVIEDEIAGMSMPTAARACLYVEDGDAAVQEEIQREITELKQYGIGAVVTLTENPLAAERFRKAGLEYMHIPVPDMTAPTPSQIEDFVAFAKQVVKKGKAVVVHCLGGSGRTGTMLACYLVDKGHSAREAIRTI